MTLLEHLESCGVDLRKQKKPGEYLALCPGCGKYKLAINVDKKKWQCWTCAVFGGTFALCKFLNIKSFDNETQNFRKLRQQFVDIPKETIKITNNGGLPKDFIKIGSNIGNFMQTKAKQFLYNRGVTDRQIEDWGLGFCINGPYTGFLIIPVVDREGVVRTWQGRRIWGVGNKNANPTDVDKIPFNLQYARRYPGCVIVEGPFDAMAVHSRLSEALNISSIGLMGHTCSPLLARQIVNYVKPQWIWIALDPDIPRAECERLAGTFRAETNCQIKVVFMPKDPDEVVNIDEWKALLSSAQETVLRRINR
jgi:hypothetical protein